MFDGFIKPTIDTDIHTNPNIDMSVDKTEPQHHYHAPTIILPGLDKEAAVWPTNSQRKQ
jgi:hypothetical protein